MNKTYINFSNTGISSYQNAINNHHSSTGFYFKNKIMEDYGKLFCFFCLFVLGFFWPFFKNLKFFSPSAYPMNSIFSVLIAYM